MVSRNFPAPRSQGPMAARRVRSRSSRCADPIRRKSLLDARWAVAQRRQYGRRRSLALSDIGVPRPSTLRKASAPKMPTAATRSAARSISFRCGRRRSRTKHSRSPAARSDAAKAGRTRTGTVGKLGYGGRARRSKRERLHERDGATQQRVRRMFAVRYAPRFVRRFTRRTRHAHVVVLARFRHHRTPLFPRKRSRSK